MTQENLPGTLKVAIVDTETTGLEYDDQAVSVGVVLVEIAMPKGTLVREIDSYYGLREPTVRISDGARAVHGLSDDDLAGEALDMVKLRELVKSADVLVAHNAQFDSRIATVHRDRIG
jgi:DNA polymerase III subunit epsilon